MSEENKEEIQAKEEVLEKVEDLKEEVVDKIEEQGEDLSKEDKDEFKKEIKSMFVDLMKEFGELKTSLHKEKVEEPKVDEVVEVEEVEVVAEAPPAISRVEPQEKVRGKRKWI